MKKVLILTTSTGQGHNQAAKSLCEVFQNNGFTYINHDFLSGSSSFLKNAIVGGYEVSATQFSKLYGLFYKITNNKYINTLISIPFFFVSNRLEKIISKEKPDIIISTHPLCVNVLHSLKKRGIDIPMMSIVTDFKAHSTYISNKIDSYVTGSNFTKQSLIYKGIDPSIIHPYGIPIRSIFFERDENISNVKTDDYFNILLMSGSMGLKSISYVLEELLNNDHKLRITVVCGNNKHLKKSLDKHTTKIYANKKLHILGFSNDIASFMEYSDVIISKPGGLTVTESIAKHLPLIIPFAIPGQEMENTEFLTNEGYALRIENTNVINDLVDDLIENPEKLNQMKNKLSSLAKTYSSQKIVDLANDLLEEKKI